MAWIHDLDVPEDQRKVLTVLLGMVDGSELVDGRCAGVTYTAEVARCDVALTVASAGQLWFADVWFRRSAQTRALARERADNG